MTSHLHTWVPIEGEMGRYSCSCGATGYRRNDGSIAPYRGQRRVAVTAHGARVIGADGRVPALIPEDTGVRRK